jgi:hypothetical protein
MAACGRARASGARAELQPHRIHGAVDAKVRQRVQNVPQKAQRAEKQTNEHEIDRAEHGGAAQTRQTARSRKKTPMSTIKTACEVQY